MFLLLITVFMLISCGEAIVELDNKNYVPKIVLEGYLVPDKMVQTVKITRNIPLNTEIYRSELSLKEASVQLTSIDDGKIFTFEFNPKIPGFQYHNNDLQVGYGKEYRLDVRAKIDGAELHTSAQTKTPLKGFSILDQSSTDSISYLDQDAKGELINPQINFYRSPETDFYMAYLIALDADSSTFIYPPVNPYLYGEYTASDVQKNVMAYIYSNDFLFNTPLTDGREVLDLGWYHFKFYGQYLIILSAGDKNMKDYILTYNRVYENDGNLHEPVFHIKGDGIGVFGSSINDTLFMKILP